MGFPQLTLFQSALAIISFLIILSATNVGSLQCYQCGSTAARSHECQDDIGGFVNTSLGLTDKYAKNCTDANVNWTRCVIQTAELARGDLTLYHRGCHDGRSFTKLNYHPVFEGLPANNESTCARIEGTKEYVCFRFCDTDYCNGPQPPEDPCDNTSSIYNGGLGCPVSGVVSLTGMLLAIQVCAGILLLGLFL